MKLLLVILTLSVQQLFNFHNRMCVRRIEKCCHDWEVKIEGLHSMLVNHFPVLRGAVEKFIFKTEGCQKKVTCVSLPQSTPSRCQVEREKKLEENQKIYYLTKPATEIPDYPITDDNIPDFISMPVLNKTIPEVYALSVNNKISAQWTLLYTQMLKRIVTYFKKVAFDPTPLTSYMDYAKLLSSFREVNNINEEMNKYFVYPAKEGMMKDIIHHEKWQDDQVFAEQRLAGFNPFLIRRLRYAEFSDRFLDIEEELDEAIEEFVDDGKTMNEMVQDGLAYIVDFPLLQNLTDVEDITLFNKSSERTMRGTRSPIAFFISMENTLKPVAIKVALKSTQQVYTPNDGTEWLLAKEEVQRADYMRTQIVEHLLKTHLTMEPICTVLERTLSKFHPLHQLLRWHCMGTHFVNSNGLPALLGPAKITHLSFSIGHIGSIELLNKAYDYYTWEDMDFEEDLKKRGVDDASSLPYYPFRDDGIMIWRLVKQFCSKYVDLYYDSNDSVQKDYELQNFLNEISSDGSGQFGGVGMVKEFPTKLTSKSQLMNLLSRIVFLPLQHHTINYPISYYGGYVPNAPTKLYDDPRVPEGEFGFYSLPHRFLATSQVNSAMNLGTIRYDKLFDYGPKLTDKAAQKLVQGYFSKLHSHVRPILEKRNTERLRDGHLSYPYFLPQLMPNSIQS